LFLIDLPAFRLSSGLTRNDLGVEFYLVLRLRFQSVALSVERPDNAHTRNFRVVRLGSLLKPLSSSPQLRQTSKPIMKRLSEAPVERHNEWHSDKPPDHLSLNIWVDQVS